MRRTARRLKGELHGRLEAAHRRRRRSPSPASRSSSVIREGLETALLFYAAAQGATSTADAAASRSPSGSLTAVADRRRPLRGRHPGRPVAVLHRQRRAARLRRRRDPQVRRPRLPGGRRPARPDDVAFDISGVLDPNSWYGAALAGMFNITAAPTVLETVAYLAYLVPVLALFLWPSRSHPLPGPVRLRAPPRTPIPRHGDPPACPCRDRRLALAPRPRPRRPDRRLRRATATAAAAARAADAIPVAAVRRRLRRRGRPSSRPARTSSR